MLGSILNRVLNLLPALGFVILWSQIPASSPALARQDVLSTRTSEVQVPLGSYLEFLEDPKRLLELDDVRALPDQAWTMNQARVPSFGFTKSRYWLRLRLHNAGNERVLRLLEAQYTHYDFISFHLMTKDGIRTYKLGDHQPFAERPVAYRNFTVPIQLEPDSGMEIYIVCDSSGTLFFPLQLWDPLVFASSKSKQDYFSGYYYGLLIGMLVYNGFLFLTLRRPTYLYYALYILGFFFFQLSVHGYAFPLLWPQATWWANNCVPLFLVFSLFWVTLFTRDFMETNRQTPWLHWGIRAVMVACVGIGLLSLGGFYSIAIRAGTVLSLLSAIHFLICGGVTLYRGFAPARFYVLAFTAFLGGIIINALMQLGLLEPGFFTEYSLQMGSALEVVLLSIALGHKIRIEQKEAHRAIDTLNKELQKSIVEVRQLNTELVEKERARTMFFHNTSHELRTPLNGILGYLKLFLMDRFGALDADSRETILKIQNLARSLLQQANTILELAKSRQGQVHAKVQNFQLKELSQHLDILGHGLQQRYPQARFQFEVHAAESGQTFCSDPEKIMTICRNLLGNAFKFERPGHLNQVRLALEFTSSGELIITISDEGIGIPADQIGLVFEEFYQVSGDSRRNYEGTGLGLAIVKQYLDLLQGRIDIESTPGLGTSMRVSLKPFQHIDAQVLADGSWEGRTHEVYQVPQKIEASSAQRDFKVNGRANILVIDDNRTNCEVITEILRIQGYRADFALSGRQGLTMLRQAQADLLLLDMMMPEMSGEDVLKAIRQDPKLQTLPVILITARASEEDRILGLGLGADDYLAKPIVPDELCLRVHNTLERLRLSKAAVEKQMMETSLSHLQRFDAIAFQGERNRGELVIQHHYRSAEVTGGDWYGLFHDDKHQVLYVLLGDVTGHGTSSGLITLSVAGAVKGWLSSLAQNSERIEPMEVLTRLAASLNDLLFHMGSTLEKSMTMCFVAIDLRSGVASYLNAGHYPIYKVQGDKVESIFRAGNPLGFQEQGRYGQQTFALAPDEMLFLYTDGLLENSGAHGQRISERDLRLILSGNPNPMQLKRNLIERAERTWNGQDLEDDVAFLIISRQQAAEEPLAG
jgi:signal transduction histidine kinase/serine phosphatase RsbU (regulator of sigma subunit)